MSNEILDPATFNPPTSTGRSISEVITIVALSANAMQRDMEKGLEADSFVI